MSPDLLSGIGALPRVELHTLWTAWQTDTLSVCSLGIETLAVVLYVLGVRRLDRRGRRWPTWRTGCYVAGVACIVVALQSGLAEYDDSVFALHMVQHALLMMVAPPLLALGAPVTLAMQATHRGAQERIASLLRSRAVAFLGSPAVAFVAAWGVMFGYFMTSFYGFSLSHLPVHVATHAIFLVTGCLYCWQIICADPVRRRLAFPQRLAYAACAVPLTAVIAVTLMTRSTSIAPEHTLADTHAGGLVLLVVGELIALGEVAFVALRWNAYNERSALRRARAGSPRRRAGSVPSELTGARGRDVRV